MANDVNAFYPSLSALAELYHRDLNVLAQSALPHHDSYLGLADCCLWAATGGPRWAHADCGNYLATLDEYVKQLSSHHTHHVWQQLTQGPETTFLDTLAEASWFLHFKRMGCEVEVHVPFDQANPQLGNADILLKAVGKELWLDVYSIGAPSPLQPPKGTGPFTVRGRTLDNVVAEISKKTKTKFHHKFPSTLREGPLKGKHLGLLVCISKREPTLLIPLANAQEFGPAVPPPRGLFSSRYSGLELVSVHTLRASSGSEVLSPVILCQWQRNQCAP